jgi:hypothetical protein
VSFSTATGDYTQNPGHGEALKKTGAQYANDLGTELKNATDEYARAVRELSSKLRTKARRVAG